ncbi:MAG: hypothetical protein ACI9DK_003027 [Vicingaceae bacterium]|jgi:hypothetical protein
MATEKSLINTTYFLKQPNYIPNGYTSSVGGISLPNKETDLKGLIAVLERGLLIQALGIVLYELLIAELEADGDNWVIKAAAPEKWKKLVNGETYVSTGQVSYRWEGLLGFNKNSLISDYIYSQFLIEEQQKLTDLGVQLPKAANSETASITPKLIRSWQRFVERYQAVDSEYPLIREDGYGTVVIDYHNNQNKTRSLYQYLIDKNELDATNFPDLEFGFADLSGSLNSLGI